MIIGFCAKHYKMIPKLQRTGFITEFIKNFMMEIYWMGIFHSFHSHLRKPQAIKWDVWAVAVYKNFNQLKQNTEYETHHKKILFLLFVQPILNQKLKNSVLRFFFFWILRLLLRNSWCHFFFVKWKFYAYVINRNYFRCSD